MMWWTPDVELKVDSYDLDLTIGMNLNVWTAASDGDLASVKAFLANGGDVNAQDENGYTPLYVTIIVLLS